MIFSLKLVVFLIFISLHVIITQSYIVAKRNADSNKVLMCLYYPYEKPYTLEEGRFAPEEIDPYLCTHLGYSFAKPDPSAGIVPANKNLDLDLGGYKRLNDLKAKNTNLKTLLYLISATNEEPYSFAKIAGNPEQRKEFVKNAAKFLKLHNFDGLIILWIWPSGEAERKNLVALLKDMKEGFESFAAEMKIPRYLIALGLPNGADEIDNGYDLPEINKYVDFIKVLTFDYIGFRTKNLAHVAPLHSLTDPLRDRYTVDYSVSHVLKKGADPNKVIIGIATFGNQYTLNNPSDTSIGSPATELTSQKGWLAYSEICEKLKNGNTWAVVQPRIGYSGPYAFRGKDWVSFDDTNMVAVKARYVNEKGLRGISFCHIALDDFRGNCLGKKYPLISTAKSTLFNISYVVPSKTNDNPASFGLSEAQENDKSANGCELPVRNVFKMEYDLTCPQDDLSNYCKLSTEGSLVSQYTTLLRSCQDGYILDSGEASSVCVKKKWLPALTPCKKTCRRLTPENLNLKCGYNGKSVDCNGIMKPGTTVLPRCNPGYRTPLVPDYETIKCQDNGEWDDVLFKCVPVCGHVSVKSVTPLIHGGRVAKYGEFPWHVAIYDKTSSNEVICGGTIISSLLVVSAAHCFCDKLTGVTKNPENYEIAVGKFSINRTVNDSQFTKFFSVKHIHLNDYHGIKFRFENDIAILELTNEITFNDFVLPACVYLQTTAVPELTPGQLLMTAGWGIDETGQQSQTLKVASLPYLNTRDCLNKATSGITDFLSRDKFCAGNHSSEAVDQGDSGGGLMYKDPDTKLFYLFGIVSFKATAVSPIAVFTNVLNHADWIRSKKENLHKIYKLSVT